MAGNADSPPQTHRAEPGAGRGLRVPAGWLAWAGGLAVVGLAYYAAARLGLRMPYIGTHVSLMWLPTGVALAAFLRWGGRMAPALAMAALAVNLHLGAPPWVAAGIAAGNTLGPWCSARLLRRWGFEPALVRRRDLALFLGAVGLGMLVTASNGTAWLALGGMLPPGQAVAAWSAWWLGDSVGALLGGVPLVALGRRSWADTFGRPRGAGNAALLLAAVGVGELVFSGRIAPGSAWVFPLLALPFFLGALLALRGGAFAASLAVLLLSTVAAWGTARGLGPLAGHSGHAGLLALWSYVTAQACCCLLVWSLAADLRASRAQLSRSEHRLRAITDNAPALICHLDTGLRFTFVNATYRDWFGVDPAAMLGMHVDDFSGPGHASERRERMRRTLATGERQSFEFDVRLGGQLRHLRSLYVPDRAADGSVQGLYVLTTDVSETKAIEERLSRLVRFDHLTGLLNRRPFEERMEEALRGVQRGAGHGGIALLFIDVDRFKAINDSLGHAAGDEVLREVARRLERAVRSSDAVGRLAGDEFVVLLERVRSRALAEEVAAKVCAGMAAPFALAGGPLAVTASVGVAWCDGAHVPTVSQLMGAADAALYEAKGGGRNTFRLRGCDEARTDHAP